MKMYKVLLFILHTFYCFYTSEVLHILRESNMELPNSHSIRISEFYKGKHIFLTGATGFLGKFIIDKLLRSCPDIGNIYVLIRPKRQKSIKERLVTLLNDNLYDTLKQSDPNQLSKIIAFSGDCSQLKLGLSEADYQTITSSVSVIFHVAATVRFDEPLKTAILQNTRGTREVAQLALQTQGISMLVHVSTAYCNCVHGDTLKEELYPAPWDWRKAIKTAEEVDDELIIPMTQKYLGPYPNTYTFTKALAEHVIKDMCDGKIPTIITRPSIVLNSWKEPVPGWIDNFNGPIGVLIACGKGALRAIYSDPKVYPDYIPVDIAIKAIIVASWYYSLITHHKKVEVVHVCSGYDKWISYGEMMRIAREIIFKVPFNNSFWVPKLLFYTNRAYYYFNIFFFHLLFAFCIDMGLKLTGQNAKLVKIQRKLFIAQNVFRYFNFQDWTFCNDNYLALKVIVLKEDQYDWSFDFPTDLAFLSRGFIMGLRRYLLNEPDETLPQAKVHLQRLYWVDKITMTILYGSLIWLIIHLDLIGHIINYFFIGTISKSI